MNLKKRIIEACREVKCDCGKCADDKECNWEKVLHNVEINKIMSDCGILKFHVSVRFQHNYKHGKYVVRVSYTSHQGKGEFIEFGIK